LPFGGKKLLMAARYRKHHAAKMFLNEATKKLV